MNVSEVNILQSLLHASFPTSEIKQGTIRLETADGQQVVMSVVKCTNEERESHCYEVRIQCPTVFLLCQLRTAVSDKVWHMNSVAS